ncbi:MAG: hypothetical protein QM811_08995 [Pirellulales bacterium]
MSVDSPTADAASVSPWPAWARGVVTALLLWHFIAQILATWNAAPPPNPLMRELATPFDPYIAAAKLDQGYRFFAPDPPRFSHLLKFEIFDKAGKPVDLNEFKSDGNGGVLPPPELRVGLFAPRPRLLYHRYFMLTEQVAQFDPIEAESREEYEFKKARFADVMSSYAQSC